MAARGPLAGPELEGRAGAGMVHPERHCHGERQDGAVGAMGPGRVEEPIPVVAHLLGGGRFQDKAHQERYARSCTESAYHPFKNNQ